MKTSSIVKSLATVVAFAASGTLHAQPHAFSGGWDRELNPVTGGYFDINQNPLDIYGCITALRSIGLTVNNPGGFSAFGLTFTSSGAGVGPTWSKSFPVDERNGVCGLMPDDLVPFRPFIAGNLSGNYRLIYNWGESSAGCGSDTTPALSLSAGSGTASPNDWSCAQLMVMGYIDFDNYTFTPLSINLVVHGIDGDIHNWMNYDLY